VKTDLSKNTQALGSDMNFEPPALIAHCDWSTNPGKRWMALARLEAAGRYTASAPLLVGDTSRLLEGLLEQAAGGSVLVGFDFPIGIPLSYAQNIGASDFMQLLPCLGSQEWDSFFLPAAAPTEISLYRPFYPIRPGAAKQQQLLDGLHLSSREQLFRRCDLPTPTRRAACPIFWTLGGQQAGKAAICGWQEVLQPGLNHPALKGKLALWPFTGTLAECLGPGRVVAAESYPAEYYPGLGIDLRRSPGLRGKTGERWGKRAPKARQANAPALLAWAEAAGVHLETLLRQQICAGFGEQRDGEDRFDALIGLFGLLEVVLGRRPEGAHPDPAAGRVEGWILGLAGGQG
jgi:hypothetical protein